MLAQRASCVQDARHARSHEEPGRNEHAAPALPNARSALKEMIAAGMDEGKVMPICKLRWTFAAMKTTVIARQ